MINYLELWVEIQLLIVLNPDINKKILQHGLVINTITRFAAEPTYKLGEIDKQTDQTSWKCLSVKEYSDWPLVFFLHGVVEIYFVAGEIVHFYLIALLLSGSNEQKVECKQTKYQWNETIVKNDFFHKDVNEHWVEQDES